MPHHHKELEPQHAVPARGEFLAERAGPVCCFFLRGGVERPADPDADPDAVCAHIIHHEEEPAPLTTSWNGPPLVRPHGAWLSEYVSPHSSRKEGQCNAMQCNAMQCNAMQCNVM